jgi:hypothetical protein
MNLHSCEPREVEQRFKCGCDWKAWVRSWKAYDNGGSQKLIRDFRHYRFNDMNLTKDRFEAFFEDATNFVLT